MASGRFEIEREEIEDPSTRQRLLLGLEGGTRRVLDKQAGLEELTENRILSLERLIAFQVSTRIPSDTKRGSSCAPLTN